VILLELIHKSNLLPLLWCVDNTETDVLRTGKMERRDAAAEKFRTLFTAAVLDVAERYAVLTYGMGVNA